MLNLINDIGAYASAKARDSDGDNITFFNTTDTARNTAGMALENSINIPPTLIKHPGEHINVFVARDLDFRGVYDLEVID